MFWALQGCESMEGVPQSFVRICNGSVHKHNQWNIKTILEHHFTMWNQMWDPSKLQCAMQKQTTLQWKALFLFLFPHRNQISWLSQLCQFWNPHQQWNTCFFNSQLKTSASWLELSSASLLFSMILFFSDMPWPCLIFHWHQHFVVFILSITICTDVWKCMPLSADHRHWHQSTQGCQPGFQKNLQWHCGSPCFMMTWLFTAASNNCQHLATKWLNVFSSASNCSIACVATRSLLFSNVRANCARLSILCKMWSRRRTMADAPKKNTVQATLSTTTPIAGPQRPKWKEEARKAQNCWPLTMQG